MDIRPVEPADAGMLLTLQRAAFVDEAWLYGTADVPSLREDLDGLRKRLSDSFTLVGVEAGRIIAAVSLREYRPGGPDIERLMVAPDCRQRGLASELMTAIEAHAQAHGHAAIQLIVGAVATQNQVLYRRLGYDVTDRFALDGYPDVMLLSMRKELVRPPG